MVIVDESWDTNFYPFLDQVSNIPASVGHAENALSEFKVVKNAGQLGA